MKGAECRLPDEMRMALARQMRARSLRWMACIIPCVLPVATYGQIQATGGLEPKPFQTLTEQPSSEFANAAFRVRPGEWLHSETENFIYHYFESFIATPVAIEAEYHYKFIARELKKDTTKWERKCHVYVFDRSEDWEAFKGGAGMDPWTGGVHMNNELFLLRDASMKWKGHLLAHETCHLVVHRFYGAGIPLWLDEGYAENAGMRSYASFFRSRGYQARPRSQKLEEDKYVPLGQLTQMASYPNGPEKIAAFYIQSERMVRFLFVIDREAFLRFMEQMSAGAYFWTALSRAYSTRWTSVEDFEREFKEFALGNKSATDALRLR